MSIGLTGCHRTGKTTLAKAYAEEHGVVFCPTKTTEVFERLGMDPKAEYPLEQRLDIQEAILESLIEQYIACGERVFITDRTPLDLAAYTLTEVYRGVEMTPETEDRLRHYINRCFDLTNLWFGLIMLIKPGIPAEEGVLKGPNSYGYVEHYAAVIMGLVSDERTAVNHFYMKSTVLDLQERVNCLHNTIQMVQRRQMEDALYDENGFAVVH
ncbi:AAA family ATPase [Methylobacillus sp.]|uniref:AAA family ATPase n=1 Tax=Methylobacillus sp. TaxID=56818 RepID=UPI0012C60274|nr:AAA family ATPase [Methylobacillus sp.]MPS48494.1 AAA family ATPase [Methylobacillus sp.]